MLRGIGWIRLRGSMHEFHTSSLKHQSKKWFCYFVLPSLSLSISLSHFHPPPHHLFPLDTVWLSGKYTWTLDIRNLSVQCIDHRMLRSIINFSMWTKCLHNRYATIDIFLNRFVMLIKALAKPYFSMKYMWFSRLKVILKYQLLCFYCHSVQLCISC